MKLIKNIQGGVLNFICKILRKRGFVVVSFNYDDRIKVLNSIDRIRRDASFLLTDNEAWFINSVVRSVDKIKGDIAEVGVFEGGSAKIICDCKGMKKLYLFDTFEGIPSTSSVDKQFYTGQYKASFFGVKKFLKKYKNVFLYKGFFPESAKKINNKKFSFVHLDVDTYQSTKDCLKYFYPKLNTGGIIVSHDYPNSRGVKKAFCDFFSDKIEPIIILADRQCMIQKIS